VDERERAAGQAREQLSEGERRSVSVVQRQADDDGTGHDVLLFSELSRS
jgi:hypothetical protein